MSEARWTWLAEVQGNPSYDFGRLDFAGVVFAVEFHQSPDELVICFRLPCCRRNGWERRQNEGYAYCNACKTKYELPNDRAMVMCWGDKPYDVQADPLPDQIVAFDRFFQNWGKNPFESLLLANELVDYLQSTKNAIARHQLPSVSPRYFTDYVEDTL